MQPHQVMQNWYRLVLELVRHTPTYSPPVASRALAYMGVTAFEVVAGGNGDLRSLAGQLQELTPVPAREVGGQYDEAVVMHTALAAVTGGLFSNTGPTGQRAMRAMETKLGARISAGVAPETVARSEAHGRAIAQHILAWSVGDGGAVVENMGFPLALELPKGPQYWVPTSVIRLQQFPLLPDWGNNRTIAMPTATTCKLPGPPEYSEDKGSAFYAQAQEVLEVSRKLDAEQIEIANFWADDSMLSQTPAGHWISIAWSLLERENADAVRSADVLARLGVGMADAFIGCWQGKYDYNLVRPVTYINRVMDPKWVPPVTTPPFPEYPSGHSTQSGAAAEVLTALYGENFAFEDNSHADEGLPARSFSSLRAAADEAGISRLYGGIHYRAAIEDGLEQG
ncbi:MAG: vanadium-dependent haloperoxidase, partial [Aestuariivirgaceae bacterium]|nr:vanadium-dependent haloperoxidase [Aestuariivirgaceae bacterium]